MKKITTLIIGLASLCSCATITTSSHQNITFIGEDGTAIYDIDGKHKLAEINDNKTTDMLVKKGVSDKNYLVKLKDGSDKVVTLYSSFNKKSLWNIIFFPGFFVDWGTGTINKYSNTTIDLSK